MLRPCSGRGFFLKLKINTYMKIFSIILLVVSMFHAIRTAETLAFLIASVLFVYVCGKDVIRLWHNLIEEKHGVNR